MYFLKIYFSDIFFLFIHHVLRKMKTGLWFKFLLFGSQTFFFPCHFTYCVYFNLHLSVCTDVHIHVGMHLLLFCTIFSCSDN